MHISHRIATSLLRMTIGQYYLDVLSNTTCRLNTTYTSVVTVVEFFYSITCVGTILVYIMHKMGTRSADVLKSFFMRACVRFRAHCARGAAGTVLVPSSSVANIPHTSVVTVLEFFYSITYMCTNHSNPYNHIH